MRLKTPSFWYDDPAGAKAAALLPLSALYLAGHKIHQAAIRPYKSSLPVICVGNLTAGGSGKTPAALALMKIVREKNLAARPCFLSRGYGGALKGPVLVEPARHDAAQAGDEPLLLARQAPVIIGADRAEGAKFAERNGHDLIVMDDGLQNPSLAKTLRIVVIDGAGGFGNGRPLPAGPLRQPLKAGLEKADAFIFIGDDRRNVTPLLPQGKPVFKARLKIPRNWRPPDKPCIAFCGLGRPEKFRNTLLETGVSLAGWHVFPDHCQYKKGDLEKLDRESAESGARLITTEKDAQRLPRDFPWKVPPDVLPVHLEWEDESAITAFLKNAVRAP